MIQNKWSVFENIKIWYHVLLDVTDGRLIEGWYNLEYMSISQIQTKNSVYVHPRKSMKWLYTLLQYDWMTDDDKWIGNVRKRFIFEI